MGGVVTGVVDREVVGIGWARAVISAPMDFSLGVSRSRGEKGESPPGRGEDGSVEEDELLRVADTARGTSGLVGSTGACHLRVAPSSARNSIFRTRLLRL